MDPGQRKLTVLHIFRFSFGFFSSRGAGEVATCWPMYSKGCLMRGLFIRSMLLSAWMFTAVALAPLTSAFAGSVVLSNLANATKGSDTVNYNSWNGDSFVTDSQSWRLNSVTLDMAAGTSSTGSGYFFIAIYSDAGTEPGTVLETLTGSTNPYNAGQYTYTAAGSGLLLNPNTRYWIVQGLSTSVSSGAGSYKTRYTGNAATTGNWSIPASGYQAYLTPGNPWDVTDFDYRKLEISATVNAVPEPSTWALGLIGAGLTAVIARRRRQRTTV